MPDNTDASPLPIYVSYSTFTTFVDWLSEMPVTPSQIDRSLWSSKFAGGNGGQLMAGLRFLKLLDDERPTEELEGLVRADAAQRKVRLASVMRAAYGDLIDKLPSMTPAMLNNALDELGATEATRRKAFSFVVNAARAADLPIAPGIAKRARNKPSKATAGRKGTKRESDKGQVQNGGSPPTPPPPPRDEEYAVVHALVQQLPPQREWAKSERARWIGALTAAVDWVVTVVDEDADADAEAS